MELRQFVYLDNLAVRSLLASIDVPVPEEIETTDETVLEFQGEGGAGGEIEVPFVGSAQLGGEFTGSKVGREMLRTRKRINDQYIFNKLHDKLEGDIVDINKEGYSKNCDLVKVKGNIETDAIYRVLKIISMFSDIAQIEEQENIKRAEELLYEKGIGVSIKVDDSRFAYAGTLKPENLWIDQERAFLGEKEYTVLGRVYTDFGSDEAWDYLDLVKIVDSIFEDETMDDLRTLASDVIEAIGGAESEYERPDISTADINNIEDIRDINTLADSAKSKIQFSVDDREIAIDGPGIVIDPIAIYW